MKSLVASLLVLCPALLAAPAEQLIPAGSVLQCVVSDKISSEVTNVGDPVLCQVSHTEAYGRFTFPYGSYLVGRFEEYKDPGHFVGKGWLELRFDHMVVGNDTSLPINGRVVATSDKYGVDREGRIHGTGHPVRDTVEWMIPVLWPIDLINLPRRGPTPVLKPETRLTIKLLDDLGVPTKHEVQHQPELVSRFNYSEPDQQAAAPIERQQAPAPVQQQAYQQPAPVQQAYQPQYQQPANPTVIVVQSAPPTIIQQAAAPVVVQQPQPRYYPAPAYYPVPAPYAYPRYYPRYYGPY